MDYAGREAGEIPGAWKLGYLWRFRLQEIEAYELAQQIPSIFALSPGAAARRRNKEQLERDLLEPLPPLALNLRN